MNLSKLTASALLITALSSAALAEEKPFYVQLNAGPSFGKLSGGNIDKRNMGTSPLVGIEAGYQFNENFRTSLSLDYLTGFSWTESYPAEPGLAAENMKFKTKSLVGMVNAYYDIMEIKGFTPYVTAGIGLAQNKTTHNQNVTGPNGSGSFQTKGTKTNFAYKAGFGTKYSLTESVSLDVRYQYAYLGKIKTNGNADVGASNAKMRTQQILAGVSFKF